MVIGFVNFEVITVTIKTGSPWHSNAWPKGKSLNWIVFYTSSHRQLRCEYSQILIATDFNDELYKLFIEDKSILTILLCE
jgi:hypothetical protein